MACIKPSVFRDVRREKHYRADSCDDTIKQTIKHVDKLKCSGLNPKIRK